MPVRGSIVVARAASCEMRRVFLRCAVACAAERNGGSLGNMSTLLLNTLLTTVNLKTLLHCEVRRGGGVSQDDRAHNEGREVVVWP